jgi:competence protein ComEC
MLTGDAEAEVTHLDPGPLDVLKVAHHGSDDAGLDGLLARSVPRVALIGVGAENSYGHPTPATLGTLAEHGVCALRTDLDGTATVEIGPAGLRAWGSSGPPPADRAGCSGPGD